MTRAISSPYLERYQSEAPRNEAPAPETDYEDFWSGEGDSVDPLNLDLSGLDEADRPDDEDLLAGLDQDLPGEDNDPELQESLQQDLGEIRTALTGEEAFSEDPQARDALLEKLNGLESQLKNPAQWQELQDGLDQLQMEFEETRDKVQEKWLEKYGNIKELADLLSGDEENKITVAELINAAEAQGISEEKLRDLIFPADAETYQKVFQFLDSVDGKFSTLVSEHQDNPFNAQVTDRLKTLLAAILPNRVTLDEITLKNMITASVPLQWPSQEKISSKYGRDHGGNAIDNNSLNNEANAVDNAFREAMRTGDFSSSGPLKDRLYNTDGDGMNWDMGNKGNAFRRWLGAIYGACGKDKDLFKATLRKNLPDEVLVEIYAIFQAGGHHSMKEGDLLTTEEINSIFSEMFDMPPLE